MVGIQSPGQGLQPNRLDDLIGKTLPINKDAGDFFFPSDLETPAATPRAYRFHHRFGLPVRYHDIESFAANSNLDLVEIHLSYKDLEVNLDQVLPTQQPIGLVVHAPELFAGDHTLDLCSADNDYRRHSIEELQRVVDISRDLRRRFDCPEPVLLVTNVGGFSEHHHLERPELQPLRQRLIDSLQQIKTSDEVEIIPQTMPPSPGTSVDSGITTSLSTPTSSRSSARKQGCASAWMPPTPSSPAPTSTPHSVRSSRPSLPFTAHLHLADAKGVDGEGLQIHDGEIDWVQLFALQHLHMDQLSPTASFIPEIWQGHKNNGEGAWLALERLESCVDSNQQQQVA